MSDGVRIRELRVRITRLHAEITGVESGVIPMMELSGEVTSEEVAEALGCSVPSANNKLLKLLRAGLLDRQFENLPNGGRRFIYRLAVPEREKTHGGE